MKKLFLVVSIFILNFNVYAIESGAYQCGLTNILLKDSGRAKVDNERGYWRNYGDEAVIIHKNWTFDDEGNGDFIFTRPNPYIDSTTFRYKCYKVTKQMIAERKRKIAKREEEQKKAREEKKRKIAKDKRERPAKAKSFGFKGVAKDIYLDDDTHLAWQDNDNRWTKVTWVYKKVLRGSQRITATNYCKNLTLGNVTDWRVPTIDELKSLITKKSNFKNIIDRGSMAVYYSSSSGPTNKLGENRQFVMNFIQDRVEKQRVDLSGYIKCVRDGK